jgi:chemotaxis protein MotB
LGRKNIIYIRKTGIYRTLKKRGNIMKALYAVIVLICAIGVAGCATVQKDTRADNLTQQVADLESQLAELSKDKEKQLSELEQAKSQLQRSLAKELSEYKAKLEMTESGLMVTFLAEVFFDSGKAQIRPRSQQALGKVAEVLKVNVPDYLVAIAGHTDNEPIKYSAWKSNWELSSARALAVLHYFIDECQMDPLRLSATAYGEYKPVSDNNTPEGREHNRRVEIVIFPKSADIRRGKGAE